MYQNGAIVEMLTNGKLNETIGFDVNRCGRLIKHKNFGVPKQSTCQTNKLAFADTGETNKIEIMLNILIFYSFDQNYYFHGMK